VDTTAVGAVTNGSSDAVIDQDPAAALDVEPTLLAVLQWAIDKGVVTDRDATILLELASIEVAGTLRGLNSGAEIRAVAARHGINEKTVRRSRDRALRSLVSVREAYLRECA
jgi:methylase of polypeptide subunit release factors